MVRWPQIAEKLRQQRLIEEADFEAAMDLFGGSGKHKQETGFSAPGSQMCSCPFSVRGLCGGHGPFWRLG